jgi:hypothetical protein
MDDKLGSEHPRSFPSQLRHLLETADGPEQVRAWTEFLDSYSSLILYVGRQIPRDHDVVMDRYAFVVERLQEQSYRRLRTFAADGRGKFTTWLMVVVRRLTVRFDDPSRPWHQFDICVHGGRFYFTLSNRQSDVWTTEVMGLRVLERELVRGRMGQARERVELYVGRRNSISSCTT